MAIELGALALAIRDQGGDQVLAKLRKIDGEAKKTGSKPVNVPVNAPGADATAAKLRLVGTSATTAAKSVSTLGSTLKTLAVGAGIGTGLLSVQAVASALMDSARAYDDLAAANRRLESTAKLTGASMASLESITRSGEQAFKLSRGTAADFSAEVTKLAQKAGDLGKAKDALGAFLELGAARGLNAEETLTAVRQAILGIDEGTDKLFNKNPSVIYKEFADSIGVAVGKLTDQQKAQALLNATLTDGAKVQGSYEKFLDSPAGKSAILRQQTEQLKQELGRMFLGIREGATSGGSSLISWLTTAIRKFNEADEAGERFWRNVVRRLRGQPLEFAPTTPTAADRARQQGPPNQNTRAPITVTAPAFDHKKAAEDAARAESDRQAQIARQVGAVETMVKLRATDIGTLQAAVRLEGLLTAELAKGTASLERRAEIQQQLQTLRQSGALIKPLEVRDLPVGVSTPTGPAKKLTVPVELQPKGLEEQTGLDLGLTFGTAIAAGFQQAFANGSATDGIKAFGATILSAFGDMFIQIGVTALTGAKFLKGILVSLGKGNPFAMAAFAAGMIAVGAAIKGAASRAVSGSSGMRGGGGSGGIGSSNLGPMTGRETIADAQIRRANLPAGARGVTTARAATMPVGPTVQVIGVETPEGQRLIGRSMSKFATRGG